MARKPVFCSNRFNEKKSVSGRQSCPNQENCMVAEQAGARDQIWQFSAFSERRNPSLHRTSTPIFTEEGTTNWYSFEQTGLIQLQQNHLHNKNRDVCNFASRQTEVYFVTLIKPPFGGIYVIKREETARHFACLCSVGLI